MDQRAAIRMPLAVGTLTRLHGLNSRADLREVLDQNFALAPPADTTSPPNISQRARMVRSCAHTERPEARYIMA
jgi:hypothetical protein